MTMTTTTGTLAPTERDPADEDVLDALEAESEVMSVAISTDPGQMTAERQVTNCSGTPAHGSPT